MSQSKPKKITSTGTCAILFARNPVPGRVKTRLQSHLSPDQVMAAVVDAAQGACPAPERDAGEFASGAVQVVVRDAENGAGDASLVEVVQ